MTDKPDKPVHRRDEAVLLLARGFSSDEAARRVGVAGSTVRRWRQNPQFEERVQATRRELFAEATGVVIGLMKKSAIVLGKALDGEGTAHQLRAARTVLTAAPSLRLHTELEQELADLQALMSDEGEEP